MHPLSRLPLQLIDLESDIMHDIRKDNSDTGDIDDVEHLGHGYNSQQETFHLAQSAIPRKPGCSGTVRHCYLCMLRMDMCEEGEMAKVMVMMVEVEESEELYCLLMGNKNKRGVETFYTRRVHVR